jgi:integrase
MTRQSFQKGYVSQSIQTRWGIAFKIRYRVRMADGNWKQRSETLHGVSGRKAARAILEQRIREATPARIEAAELTVYGFVEKYWRPYLDRRNVKPSTRTSYDSALTVHILPTLGAMRIGEVAPLNIENLLQEKLRSGLSPKTVRNLVGLLQGIFSLALDNDLILRSPIRNKHKPSVQRREKPSWTPAEVRLIIEATPISHRALFVTAALTGARLGELLALQWRHVDLATRRLRIEQSLWRDQVFPPKDKRKHPDNLFRGGAGSGPNATRSEGISPRSSRLCLWETRWNSDEPRRIAKRRALSDARPTRHSTQFGRIWLSYFPALGSKFY